MVAAIRQKVTVLPGGRIEVRSDQLQPGTQAEVIVLVENGAGSKPPLQALEELQRGIQLDRARAEEWISQAKAERAALGARA